MALTRIFQNFSNENVKRIMLLRTAGLYVVWLFILLPTTLVTVVFAPMGAVYALAMLVERQFGTAANLFAVLTCGSAGVISMWILCFHFKNSAGKSLSAVVHCVALLSASAVSILFVIYSGGTLMFRILFFGWPLMGALYFLGRLSAYRKNCPG